MPSQTGESVEYWKPSFLRSFRGNKVAFYIYSNEKLVVFFPFFVHSEKMGKYLGVTWIDLRNLICRKQTCLLLNPDKWLKK